MTIGVLGTVLPIRKSKEHEPFFIQSDISILQYGQVLREYRIPGWLTLCCFLDPWAVHRSMAVWVLTESGFHKKRYSLEDKSKSDK
jgi:hypothetical protein